jgi:hypothetical protein
MVLLCAVLFLGLEVVSLTSIHRLEDYALSAVHICSYPPYLEAASSIRNLRTSHAVMILDSPDIVDNGIKFDKPIR